MYLRKNISFFFIQLSNRATLLRVHFIVFCNDINDTKIAAIELSPFHRQLLIVPFWSRKIMQYIRTKTISRRKETRYIYSNSKRVRQREPRKFRSLSLRKWLVSPKIETPAKGLFLSLPRLPLFSLLLALSSRYIRRYRSFRRNELSVRYEFANCRRGRRRLLSSSSRK